MLTKSRQQHHKFKSFRTWGGLIIWLKITGILQCGIDLHTQPETKNIRFFRGSVTVKQHSLVSADR